MYLGPAFALLGYMTTQPPSDEGSLSGSAGAPPAFAVTAPADLTLAADRTGSTSFTVTNLLGRPARIRLMPKGSSPEEDAWFSVVGDAEVPMNVGATITAEVALAVPPSAPEGPHVLKLEVIAEDDTESVSGQSVSYQVPPATASRRFPWMLVAAGVAVLALAGGAVWFFLLRGDDGLQNLSAPLISGAPQVGQEVVADPGEWNREVSSFTFQWEACGSGLCVPIAEAVQMSYTATEAELDRTLRVTVTAQTSEGSVGSAQSAETAPVATNQVAMPQFVGASIVGAQKLAQQSGLTPVITLVNPASCSRKILTQNIAAGTPVPPKSIVSLTANEAISPFKCLKQPPSRFPRPTGFPTAKG